MIRVLVRKKADRDYYQLYYVDPLTGADRTKSAETIDRKEAERAAANWEAELSNHRSAAGEPVDWDKFRLRFEDEHLCHLARRTRESYRTALNRFELLIGKPRDVRDISAAVISELAGKLAKGDSPKSTVANILRHVRGAISWAHKVEMIERVPRFTMPSMRGEKLMKGRPLTDQEFQRLIKAVPLVRPDDPDRWVRLLRGLLLCGLRLDEALRLSWDSPPIRIDLDGAQYPRMIFDVAGQKSRKSEIVPLTPDFAEFLRQTPPEKRVGKVFGSITRAGRIISAIGEQAKIIVNANGKYASAQDLRRTFGTHWSFKVRPIILQKLMRHADIKTTLRYYVDQDANDIAAEIWQHVPRLVPPNRPQRQRISKRATPKARKNGGYEEVKSPASDF